MPNWKKVITSGSDASLNTLTTTGTITADTFNGNGSSITNLNASNLSSGTIPAARFPSALPAIDGSALTGISAGGGGIFAATGSFQSTTNDLQITGSLAITGAITGNQEITGRRPIVSDTNTTINLTLGTHEGVFLYADNASAVTVNVPTNASQAFPVGTEIDIIQAGAGTVGLVPASGVNLNGANTPIPITAQWGAITIKQIETDRWIVVGKI